jgi:hypothetical protein
VTLEHEYILILRKGSKRTFTGQEAKKRRRSTYFWEERNDWFSDMWIDLVGVTQNLTHKEARKRSAAFPFELPFRLINMFSVLEDVVLDPFLGIGTTMAAAMVCGRNSIGYELEPILWKFLLESVPAVATNGSRRLSSRLRRHLDFVRQKTDAGHEFKYRNRFYGFPVMTRQEIELVFQHPKAVCQIAENTLQVDYDTLKYDPSHRYVPQISKGFRLQRLSQGRLFDDSFH